MYSSYVAGIVSMDQRLVRFQLRPGTEDPGPGHWGGDVAPAGHPRGLLATFNGGFRLDSAGGGFYLNGGKGALVNGAASVVYYRDGTIKIGTWGGAVQMGPDVAGMRQNLKLMVRTGRFRPGSARTCSSAGARPSVAATTSGVPGSASQGRPDHLRLRPGAGRAELAKLLQPGGRVTAATGHQPGLDVLRLLQGEQQAIQPDAQALLNSQQGSALRYYQTSSRDFTVVFATVPTRFEVTEVALPAPAHRASWTVAVCEHPAPAVAEEPARLRRAAGRRLDRPA